MNISARWFHAKPGVAQRLRSIAVVLVVSLLAASCSSGSSPAATTTASDGEPPTAGVPTTPPIPTAEGPSDSPVVPATPTPPPPPNRPPTPPPPPNRPPTVTPAPISPATPSAVPSPTPVDTADLLAYASLEAVACPADVAAAQVSCSLATLPRDVASPSARESVQLMVAFVDNGDPNGIGPVVFLQGGPGVSAVTQAPRFVGAAHDVLFVDQRGTGYSTPKLDCPEVDALWEAQYTDDEAVRLPDDGGATIEAAYAACAGRLEAQGIDFDDFNTTAAAFDIDLLRQLFGYDSWALWGISYGTRLGLTVMRDHPEGVRAAVLDSIVPFEIDFFATIPENGLRAIRALDAACDVDSCRDEHGDFFDNLSALVRRLNDEPAVVTATRPGRGATFPFRVDGKQLMNMVFTQMYSTRSLRSLPRQIARADFGGLEEIVANYVSRRDPTELDLSIGLYYTTWCREEFPFYDETVDDALLDELEPLFGDAAADALSSDGVDTLCGFFSVEPDAGLDDQPLVSEIPTLVFAGAFDPITPPSWSQQVAASLPNVTYVEMPDHGHGMASSCPTRIRVAFLIDPSVTPDTTCADEALPPDFE